MRIPRDPVDWCRDGTESRTGHRVNSFGRVGSRVKDLQFGSGHRSKTSSGLVGVCVGSEPIEELI